VNSCAPQAAGRPAGPWTAIVLAGKRPDSDPLAASLNEPYKALVRVCDRPMLDHVLSALLRAPEIGRIVVVAQDPDILFDGSGVWRSHLSQVSGARSMGGISESIADVLASGRAPWPVLVTTADHPLLSPDIIREFLAGAGSSDVAVGAVERRTVLARFPATRRTWLKFSEGAYSGANLYALSSESALQALALWAKAERDRKHAARLFWHFGPILALRALTRTISFAEALRRAGQNLGVVATLVPLGAPEAAIDVDKPEDHQLVEWIMISERRRLAEADSSRSPKAAPDSRTAELGPGKLDPGFPPSHQPPEVRGKRPAPSHEPAASRIPAPVVAVGENRSLLWGLTASERARRIAKKCGLSFATRASSDGHSILVNSAFVFDPAWLRHYAALPGQMLTLGGIPVIAHCRYAAEAEAAETAMLAASPVSTDIGLVALRYERGVNMVDKQLRKRTHPFALALDARTIRTAERTSYYAAYKGVTDVLTKYLWPEWALALTRIAARFGISPNMVTSLGAILCVAATLLFWKGLYWSGMAAGLGFMVLDTVDGKLARCTITSSKWGNIFDHGLDLVHPPFWWFAWAVGLEAYGRPLSSAAFGWTMSLIIGGYLVQRLIEGIFMRVFDMHIHIWRKIDSDFRLFTARRNPNMVILFAGTAVGRPDLGLVAVAGWTVFSCLFHFVRLVQSAVMRARGRDVSSWLV
jgi:phosphatidylglycerophosphate synthase/GTP:adenosylcobinamide-phosphate guanylyltransferase